MIRAPRFSRCPGGVRPRRGGWPEGMKRVREDRDGGAPRGSRRMGFPPYRRDIALREKRRWESHGGSSIRISGRARCGWCGRPAGRSRRSPGIWGLSLALLWIMVLTCMVASVTVSLSWRLGLAEVMRAGWDRCRMVMFRAGCAGWHAVMTAAGRGPGRAGGAAAGFPR
jgi:hypothetical protein